MAALNGNTVYLTVGGTSVGAYWRSCKVNGKNNVTETTAGSGTTHVERTGGLDDYSYDIVAIYDAADVATYIQKFKPGTVEDLEWGPEGNTAGKPRMVQSVVIDECSFEVVVEKELVVFEVKASGAAAPSVNAFAGGVYS